MKKTSSRLLERISHVRGVDYIFLAAGLITYALVTLRTITASSIWFDEAFSAYLTRFNYTEIALYTATDVHPPLYYWILKAWTSLFGTTELGFRSLSLVFALVAIVFGFLLVRRLFGRKAAWIAVLLLAFSPMLVRYGQEARMYTMAAAIGIAATYVLSIAVESKKRRPWVIYGILVGLGMLTHYFMALVWLAHWVWRFIVTRQQGLRGKDLRKAFFTKNWIIAHSIAIGLFIWWLPFMAIQLTTIQASGFWIGSVSVDTLPGYVTNVLFYLEHGKATGWYGAAAVVVVLLLVVFGIKLYRNLNKKQQKYYLLLLTLAVVPVLILFIASLPPLKSSFVERYVMSAIIGFSLVAGVIIALGMAHLRKIWQVLAVVLVVSCMIVGVSNVYYYGNYNKNSNTLVGTRELVEGAIARSKPGEPIIAADPWIFYEAVFYDSTSHPIYFIDADTHYIYGSLDMLKYSNAHKINDLAAFAKANPIVWYIGGVQDQTIRTIPPARSSWTLLQSFSVHNPIDNNDIYKAGEFKIN